MFVRPEVVSPVSGIVCPFLGSFSGFWDHFPPLGFFGRLQLGVCVSGGVLEFLGSLTPLNGRLLSDTRPPRRISLFWKHLDFGWEAIVWKEAFEQSHPLEGCPSPGDV